MQALSQLSYGPTSAVSLAAQARYPDLMRRRPGARSGVGRLPRRFARFVYTLFGSSASPDDSTDAPADAEGGVGVREPRRPLTPTLTGAAALELPTDGDDESR